MRCRTRSAIAAKAIFTGIGRLKPGVSRARAQANMALLARDLARENPDANEGHTVGGASYPRGHFCGNSSSYTPILFASAALLIVVGIVLLIACSNVANLLLARSAARQQEMAVRLAMGASRYRLVRQLLTESVFLGLLSGAVGMLIGYAGMQLLMGALPGSANFVTPKLDATVFVFALCISLATGFIFGIIPAFRASRANVAEALKEEGRTTGRSRRRVTLANALLVGQVAFSFLLLVTAGLFLRSIGRAYDIDPGFQTTHLAVFMTNPGQAGYKESQTKAFYKEVRERVAQIPGVAVGVVGLEPAAVGPSREWTGGGRAAAAIAGRQDHHDREHGRPRLFRDGGREDRSRARVHEYRPGDILLRWPS